jgi:hypothetical protein
MNIDEQNQLVIKEEMEAIKADIIAVYNASGKKVSGEFEKGLEIKYTPTSASLTGYVYLAGRVAGRMPPIESIEKWLIQKGIKPIEDKMKISSLAYLIARKIGKEGTKKENHLHIYDEVITPERIDSILQRLNKINVTAFINEVNVMIEKLVQNK